MTYFNSNWLQKGNLTHQADYTELQLASGSGRPKKTVADQVVTKGENHCHLTISKMLAATRKILILNITTAK